MTTRSKRGNYKFHDPAELERMCKTFHKNKATYGRGGQTAFLKHEHSGPKITEKNLHELGRYRKLMSQAYRDFLSGKLKPTLRDHLRVLEGELNEELDRLVQEAGKEPSSLKTVQELALQKARAIGEPVKFQASMSWTRRFLEKRRATQQLAKKDHSENVVDIKPSAALESFEPCVNPSVISHQALNHLIDPANLQLADEDLPTGLIDPANLQLTDEDVPTGPGTFQMKHPKVQRLRQLYQTHATEFELANRYDEYRQRRIAIITLIWNEIKPQEGRGQYKRRQRDGLWAVDTHFDDNQLRSRIINNISNYCLKRHRDFVDEVQRCTGSSAALGNPEAMLRAGLSSEDFPTSFAHFHPKILFRNKYFNEHAHEFDDISHWTRYGQPDYKLTTRLIDSLVKEIKPQEGHFYKRLDGSRWVIDTSYDGHCLNTHLLILFRDYLQTRKTLLHQLLSENYDKSDTDELLERLGIL